MIKRYNCAATPALGMYERPDGSWVHYWSFKEELAILETHIQKLTSALEDICTADETSTLAGAVAIARSALND